MSWREFDIWAASLCAWREARGEGGADANAKRDSLRAVIHVIKNRADKSGKSWAYEVFRRLQFSSMTYPHDPQLCLVPEQPDSVFTDCFEIATTIMDGGDFDLTQGATHYFADTIPMPEWAKTMTQTAKFGHHIFFK